MSDGSLRPMRPIQRVPFVEPTLPILDPGAAGPNSNPAPPNKPCAGFGLNTPANEREFATGFKNLQQAWPTLTAAQRQQKIEDLTNAQLQKSGVPRVGIVPSDLPTNRGQFDQATWNLAINKDLLNRDSLTDMQAKSLANTVYHESRHAEQWYVIAQQKAAEQAGVAGQTPEQQAVAISNAMGGVPAGVAASAQQHPLGAQDGRKACAQALNDSLYGANRASREQTLDNQKNAILADNAALAHYNDALVHYNSINGAYERLRQDPKADPAAVQRAYEGAVTANTQLQAMATSRQATAAARQNAYQAYQRLPEEADALETGDAVEKVY